MLSRLQIKYIGGVIFVLRMITACGGGGDINFNIERNNWPWPWKTDAKFFAHKTFSQNVTVTNHIHFQLDGVNGQVDITGQPGADTVSVTATARVGSDSYDDARKYLDQLAISITDEDGEIAIKTLQPGSTLGRQYIVDYTLVIPSNLSVNVNLANGHVSVEDLENQIFVVVENGNVSLSDIYDDAIVNVENGSINGIISLPADGEIVVSTVNGNIDLRIPTITSAELFALVGNGTISWYNLDLRDDQQTDHSVQGVLGEGTGLIDLETVNGDIDLTGVNI